MQDAQAREMPEVPEQELSAVLTLLAQFLTLKALDAPSTTEVPKSAEPILD